MFQLLAEYFKSVFSETDLDRSPLDLLSFLCHHGHHFIDQTREGSGQSDASIDLGQCEGLIEKVRAVYGNVEVHSRNPRHIFLVVLYSVLQSIEHQKTHCGWR